MSQVSIFIDDERMPPSGDWLVARTAEQFLELLGSHSPAVISFDHDLGCDEAGAALPSGQTCMHHLVDHAIDHPDALGELCLVVLHSANPVGRANMRGLLESAQRSGILPDVAIVDLPVTSCPITGWQLGGVTPRARRT